MVTETKCIQIWEEGRRDGAKEDDICHHGALQYSDTLNIYGIIRTAFLEFAQEKVQARPEKKILREISGFDILL